MNNNIERKIRLPYRGNGFMVFSRSKIVTSGQPCYMYEVSGDLDAFLTEFTGNLHEIVAVWRQEQTSIVLTRNTDPVLLENAYELMAVGAWE